MNLDMPSNNNDRLFDFRDFAPTENKLNTIRHQMRINLFISFKKRINYKFCLQERLLKNV